MASNGCLKSPIEKNRADRQLKSNEAEAVPRKRKRTGPFRIKTGCVVALRFRPELKDCRISVIQQAGNEEAMTSQEQQIIWDDDYTCVWTKPCVGRDEGLALIGKRIRCVFPKNKEDPKSKRKVLEGEIIRLVDYGDRQLRGARRGFVVELLMEKRQYELFSFLQRGNEGWGSLKANGGTAMKNQNLEERIRGKDTVSVIVNLMKPWWMEYRDDAVLSSEKFLNWTVEKLVPTKLFHHSTNTKKDSKSPDTEKVSKERRKSKGSISTAPRYMGNGNDPADQQINNFRWTARRYHDIRLSVSSEQESVPFSAEMLSTGFAAEVVKVESTQSNGTENGTSTLAMVTLQRIFLPEHTYSGRLSHDDALTAYPDHAYLNSDRKYILKVPIEHLVIISKKLVMEQNTSGIQQSESNDVLAALLFSYSYSQAGDFYFPSSIAASLPLQPDRPCHRCRRIFPEDNNSSSRSEGKASWFCQECINTLDLIENESSSLLEKCECRRCVRDRSSCKEADLNSRINKLSGKSSSNSFFSRICHKIDKIDILDFQLPNRLMSDSAFPISRGSVSTKVKQKGPTKVNRSSPGRPSKDIVDKAVNEKRNKKKLSGKVAGGNGKDVKEEEEDFSVFKPTCVRSTPYDRNRKRRRETFESNETTRDKPRCLRGKEDEKNVGEVEKDEKTTSGRAARANQRRVMKGVASFGSSSTLNIDTLASREPQLRFDRSGIHAWGVFADEDIAAGEMILEYRGEIIGNSIAERREVEYEAAKIGSDYMFRIDAANVCDATKQGCVARFINASCEPNCYTKIITLDGNKRIVIYAKRNIRTGEELCYDYKFPLEYDESKRIPCYCGAKECRGYMNWVSNFNDLFRFLLQKSNTL